MKILVDHGVHGNLGDISMVEAVVLRILAVLPRAEICVMNKPNLETSIWNFPNVSKTRSYSLKPIFRDVLNKTPFFWRVDSAWQKISYKLTLQSMGTLIPGRSIPIYDNDNAAIRYNKLGKFCEEFDALHIAGGGNLTDLFLHELFNKCCFMHTFSEQNKPIILTGQQIGPFSSRSSKRALQKVLRKVNFLGLREPTDSLNFCMEAHMEPQRYAVMGDDSLGLMPLNDSFISDFLAEYGLKEKEFIAANIRIAPYAKGHADYIRQIVLIIEKVAMHFDKPVLIVPTALHPSDSDITSGKKLADGVHHARMVVIDNDNLSPALVKGVLGKAFGAIGISYHFCIFALSQGVPTVCLYDGAYYSQKAKGICVFWGDERLALPLKDVDVDSAVGHIAQLFKDESFREKMLSFGEKAFEQWRYKFDTRVSDILGRLN